ncbi:EamA-like transporter family protein [Rhodobacteraceae bacterium THAF1]|uniref:DMT family transporter n=1 Tax=Palleronia sp. THAF1 TaxID=2587842 RepID=UPI000F3CE688|nr:DMT family transporter [Palleronia sp. THAF1]QFU07831.1 EamA-like transporter family protein [Palleronia sp. THAF1]VDC25652.1 EamA-like transporter family protein [Rhodobacteraceae bacterium THAF1]
MKAENTQSLASLIVVATGAMWGLYWLPVRQLEQAGLSGAWGTLVAVAIGALLLSPLALYRRRTLCRATLRTMAFTALGGAAFVLYSIGFVYGRVAIIILLFFLTPVWSALIGRYIMGWRNSPARLVAIVMGLLGLGIILSADGQLPLPRNVGEWMALASGVLWSISSTGIRTSEGIPAIEAGFVFALGGCAAALVLAPLLAPIPTAPDVGAIAGWGLAAGGLWWAASMAALMWATARLEPTRTGILLMSEVVVGAVSGALLAGEVLGRLEIAGGTLVIGAAILEIRSTRRTASVSA